MSVHDGTPDAGDHVIHEDDPRQEALYVEDVYVEGGVTYLWVITQGNDQFEMREDQVYRIV